MQPHLVLRFSLGLLFGTSAAILIPRDSTTLNNTNMENGTLQERTTIYFPGPIPGRSDTRVVHGVQVPAELTSRSSSDATTAEQLVDDEENGDNGSKNVNRSVKRAGSAGEATPGTKNDKTDPKEVAEAVTNHTFKVIGQIALGVGIPVIIIAIVVVWYKHHKRKPSCTHPKPTYTRFSQMAAVM